jgi:hypothetical protein
MNEADFFNPNGGDAPAKVDRSLEDELKVRVSRIIKSSPNATEENLISEVDAEIDVVTAPVLVKWAQERKYLETARAGAIAKAKAIQRQLDAGEIPKNLPGEETFHLTPCPWRRAIGLGLGAIALLTSGFELVNYAAFCAPNYDSFPISLSNCFPVLLFGIAEAVILHSGLFSKRSIKRCMLLQGLLGAVAGCAFLFFRFQRNASSLAFLTQSSQTASLSPEDICMGLQIFTSLCLAAVCLQGAIAMWVKRSTSNPDYVAAQAAIESWKDEANRLDQETAPSKGAVESFHALKRRLIVSTKIRWARLNSERERFQQNMNNILNEPL